MAGKKGKRTREANKHVEAGKIYSLQEASALIKKNATAKFDETIDVALMLGVDPKYSDQMVRGVASLPHGTGKNVRVAVFAKGDKAIEAKEAGADIVGEEDLAEMVKNGQMDFDRCIATPDMMVLVGKVGKILGPRGLMPNPKLGTVTTEIGKAVKAAKGGQVEFRVEKAGIVHAGVGKTSLSEEQIAQNIAAFITIVKQAKPTGAKGTYMLKAVISSTMGPGVRLDLGTVSAAA